MDLSDPQTLIVCAIGIVTVLCFVVSFFRRSKSGCSSCASRFESSND